MSEPTWWFVITSPVGDTSDPEPPVEMRTHDFCRCSSHAAVGSKPYFSFSCFAGGRLKSHMPSSADARPRPARQAVTTRQVRNEGAKRVERCMGFLAKKGGNEDGPGYCRALSARSRWPVDSRRQYTRER